MDNSTASPSNEKEYEFDLTCSACNADLSSDELFRTTRVCSSCRRHYWIPARERIDLLVDPGSFAETSLDPASIDRSLMHDLLPLADRLAEAREQPSIADAVITGSAAIAGQPFILVVLDLAVLGASIGVIAGEKIALAMETAANRHQPFLAICSGGNNREAGGVLSLAQVAKLASSASRLQRAGSPFIAVLTHPTAANVLAGLVHQADIAFAEPGAYIGSALPTGRLERGYATTPESLLQFGGLDDIVDRAELRDLLARLLTLLGRPGTFRALSPVQISLSGSLRPEVEVEFARLTGRPRARDYLDHLSPEFVELRGDRLTGDDPNLISGVGNIAGVTTLILANQRSSQAPSSITFGEAIRVVRLAAQLELPVVALIETGRSSGVPDDLPTGLSLARWLKLIASLPVPIVTVCIGETNGASGLALMAADRILMQEHAVISLGPGDPMASASDCLRLGLIDEIVPEPNPTAAADFGLAADHIRSAVGHALMEIASAGSRRLIDERARKFRLLGFGTVESREMAKMEIHELQDLQRLVTKSIGDIKQRWESRQVSLPARAPRPSMPTITMPKLNVRRPDFGDLANKMAAARRLGGNIDPRDTTSPPDATS